VNLVLLEPEELRPDGTAALRDRRATHLRDVLRAGPGDRVQAGLVGGRMGAAEVVASSAHEVVLRPAPDCRRIIKLCRA
jgi:16S rRNA U1498 N3-methylase RsmE